MMSLCGLASLCALFLLIHSSAAQYKAFDCRRSGVICQTASGQKGACQIDGTCECPNPAFKGYDCSVAIASVKTTNCSLNCGSNECFTDGGVDRCRCDPGYYGRSCERKRVSVVDCTATSMTVNVNPQGDFQGKIYVLMPSMPPACVFRPVPPTGDLEGYELTLNLSNQRAENPCAAGVTKRGSASSYDVIVQYSSHYLAHTDERHVVTCQDGGDVGLVGVVIDSGGLDSADINRLTGDNVTQTSLGVPVNMQVVDLASGNLASSVIAVGDSLALRLTLDTSAPSEYVDFYVETCSSFNREIQFPTNGTFQQLLEKVLVLNRCPAPDAMDVVSSILRKSGRSVTIPFRGFKFDGYDSLYFTCSVKLCKAADASACDPVQCAGGSAPIGFGRKRRQAEVDDAKVNVTRRVFVVTIGDNTVRGHSQSRVAENQPCIERVAFVATAVVFGIVLTVALVAAIVLCLRSHRLQTQKRAVAKA